MFFNVPSILKRSRILLKQRFFKVDAILRWQLPSRLIALWFLTQRISLDLLVNTYLAGERDNLFSC